MLLLCIYANKELDTRGRWRIILLASSSGGFDGYLEHSNYLSSSLIGTIVLEYGIRSQILWNEISVTWRSPKMLEPDAR